MTRHAIRKQRKKSINEVRLDLMASLVKLQKALESNEKQTSREEIANSLLALCKATVEKILEDERSSASLEDILETTFEPKKQNEYSLGQFKEKSQQITKKDSHRKVSEEIAREYPQDTVLKTLPEIERDDEGFVTPKTVESLRHYHPEVVLFAPQIPPNTGTVARLCAAMSAKLNLIEPMGFKITDKEVKRAGLDYWEYVDVTVHKSWEAFVNTRVGRRFVFVETGTTSSPQSFNFEPGDILVFGPETTGLPDKVLSNTPNSALVTIPMFQRGVRSINLANSVSIVLQVAISKLHNRL